VIKCQDKNNTYIWNEGLVPILLKPKPFPPKKGEAKPFLHYFYTIHVFCGGLQFLVVVVLGAHKGNQPTMMNDASFLPLNSRRKTAPFQRRARW
jgi:hypothetical protein